MLRPGLELDDRLARVHGEAELEAVLLGPVANGERRAHRALGIVAVRDGSAEDAHHGVADELLHVPAVALQLRADTLVVRDEKGADVLGVEALGASVKPARSTKRTETMRRSSPARPGAARPAPHALQNFAPSGFSSPHRAQVSTSARLECARVHDAA